MFVRICSQFLPGENIAYDETKGILPIAAMPDATDADDCSIIPISKNRFGNSFANASIFVDSVRSQQSPTTRSSARPASTSPSPKPARIGACSTSVSKSFGLSDIINYFKKEQEE